MKVYRNLIILFLALSASITLCQAAAAPKGKEWLTKEADAIVTGVILEVSSKTRDVKDFGGTQTITTYASKVKIEKIKKGKDLKLGQVVTIYSRRHAWNGPGVEPPGHHGHFHTPVKGQQIEVFYKVNKKFKKPKNEVLFPNGMKEIGKSKN